MSRSMSRSTSIGPKRLLTLRSSTRDIGPSLSPPPGSCGETDDVRHDFRDSVAVLGVVGDIEAAVAAQRTGRVAQILVRQVLAHDNRCIAVPGHACIVREIDPD